MFGLASFYIAHDADFTLILMVILFVDIIWSVATRGVSPHQDIWFLNNSGHLAGIFVCYGVYVAYHSSVLLYIALAFLFSNGCFDFVKSAGFYFADISSRAGIFLSAPFTQLIDAETSELSKDARAGLEAIIDHLEARGWTVANAHRRERWGAVLDSPLTALTADLAGIGEASALVAILGAPPSPGVQLEVGFALARGKKIVLIVDDDDPVPYLIRGVMESPSILVVRPRRAKKEHHELGDAIADALGRLGAELA